MSETIRHPSELRNRSIRELEAFAADVRRFLLENISKTGGHIGANLGTVELTIALHTVFDSPREPILWDCGHQAYTHKIVTGRANMFPTLNTFGGMSRFASRAESGHDILEASHAGTAISQGLGIALARKLEGNPDPVVVVVGDASLAEGSSLEALNHAAVEKVNLLIVVNDNGYAISPGFGVLHKALRSNEAWEFFWNFGIYEIPFGHDLDMLVRGFRNLRLQNKVCVVRVATTKGNGWPPADKHPYRAHFLFPFDPVTGEEKEKPKKSYADVAAEVLLSEMEKNPKIVCITPSTRYATGLEPVFARFPERCFDPGMAEQHAMSLAAGFAHGGMKPVIFYQSTFLQRAFDQLFHDVCAQNLPVLILSVRSGLAGYDSPTHHGIYDLSYLRSLPNLQIYSPTDGPRLISTMEQLLRVARNGPSLVLMPYGEAAKRRTYWYYAGGTLELLIVASGNMSDVVEELCARGFPGHATGFLFPTTLPLPKEIKLPLNAPFESVKRIVTLEENVLPGGLGEAVAGYCADKGLKPDILRIGLPCEFLPPGSREELRKAYGLDAESVLQRIYAHWPELSPKPKGSEHDRTHSSPLGGS